MHLIYLDESGNTGHNLNDEGQPVFGLCAMVVAEDRWQSLEAGLRRILDQLMPQWKATERFEVHGNDLRTGKGVFQGVSVSDRITFRDAWMKEGAENGVRLIYRVVDKKRYSAWLVNTFGHGVAINPHIAAFALLARCVDNYLRDLPGSPLGMFISDENKQIVADVEKSIRVLRVTEGKLRLRQIVEKGFFIDSSKSLPLQLCDLFTLALRKLSERVRQMGNSRSIDDSAIDIAKSLLWHNNENDSDVLKWLTEQNMSAKKERPGDKPGVG